jgi:D-alanine transaminase/branched-chain amino acid aminotransferase
MPVVQIGRQIVGDGKPGTRTLKLLEQFEKVITEYGSMKV